MRVVPNFWQGDSRDGRHSRARIPHTSCPRRGISAPACTTAALRPGRHRLLGPRRARPRPCRYSRHRVRGRLGRNPEAAAGLAAAAGAIAHRDFEAFLADVDAVAFSVRPDVQSELAVRAARAGKHLLLEKPLALTDEASDALVAAVDAAGVASVVFFTSRFQPDARAWLEDVTAAGGWYGGHVLWLGSVYAESSPFDTPWRRQKGGLWISGRTRSHCCGAFSGR